jgi:AraC family transcriptional regulator
VNIDVVERQPVRVAYLRYTGPFGEPIGKFWRNTVSPWLADHDLIDCPRYGVTIDNPRLTPPEKCRGRYAVTRFKGVGADIGHYWGKFAAECSARGLLWDTVRPPFEHYPRGALIDHKTGIFACELCIPVGS